MVKKITIALLCTALGTSLYARDDISQSSLFVGLELESTKTDANIDLVGSPFGLDLSNDSVIEYGIRLGAEKNEWRTTLLYTYGNDDKDGLEETMHKGSLLLDYFIWSSGSTAYNVKPYIGAHVGYMSYEASAHLVGYGVDQILMDDSGIFYGGQAGIAMTISDVVQLDLSYKYSITSIDDVVDMQNTGIPGLWLDTVYGLDNMGTIALSINYFY